MKKLILAAAIIAMSVRGAWAHHSYSMFDDTKTFSVQGVVKEFQWTNPHIWVELTVSSGPHAGAWSFEGGTLPVLRRMGWARDAIKAGDTVTISSNPLKNGEKGGSLLSIKLADGRTLSGGARATNEKTDPSRVER
jgi:Family of unknown function (DUF6152)